MTADLLVRNLAAHWIQSGLLVATALAMVWLLKLKDPRFRLTAFQLVLLAVTVLPLMQPWQPEPMPLTSSAFAVGRADAAYYASAVADKSSLAPWLNPARGIVMIVLAGIAIRLLWLLYGIVGLIRFSRRASEVGTPPVAGELEARIGVSPRYVQQTVSRGPWTFGLFRPTVALPASFHALPAAFQRTVICHELIHVQRRDTVRALAEELVVASLWFHPWVWVLRARIRIAREQVVDADALGLIGNRDEYVRCLVAMSGHDLAPHFSQASAGMLRPRELRARVNAIFQEGFMSRKRLAAVALALIASVVGSASLAAWAMPMRVRLRAEAASARQAVSGYVRAARTQTTAQVASADAPRRQIKMGFAEYPVEALEKGIGGVVNVAITINPAGDVTTASIVSGPDVFHASAFKAAMGSRFSTDSSSTSTTIAIEYFLTSNSWGVRVGNYHGPDTSGAYRVGGSVRAPRKIHDVPPVYPEEAQRAHVQGMVIMEARIDENGNVSETRLLRSIPLLDQAAMDAVKQWKYATTIVSGAAVPVFITVTVNFTLRDQVRLQLTLPNGDSRTMQMSPGGTSAIATPELGRIHFKAVRSASGGATLSIYGEDGQTHLGDVVLQPGGPVVASPTIPSFEIQMLP